MLGRPVRPQPRPQSSVVGVDKSMTNVEPILAELPSDEGIRSSLPYNKPSSLPLNLHPSVSRLSLNSASQEQPSDVNTTKPVDDIQLGDVDQRYGASPTPQMATGLMALFQKPVRLGENPSRPPPTPRSSRVLLPSQRASSGSSPLPALCTVPSTSSLLSQRSDTSTQSQVFELDAQSTTEMHDISHRSRPQTDESGSYRSSPPKTAQSLSAEARQCRSQLFIFQPRPNSTSTYQNDTASGTNRTLPFCEMEGLNTLSNPTTAQNTRLVSAGSSTPKTAVLSPEANSPHTSVPRTARFWERRR